MFPILFTYGPITVYSYGFFLAVAYLVGTFFFWREGKKRGYKEEKLIDFSIASLISAIVGGRLLYAVINHQLFSSSFFRIFYFWEGGFAFWGSFVLVIFTGSYLIRKWEWDFFQIADISVLSVLLATFFGKIGSFLAGNDYGALTKLPLAVSFLTLEGKRHPIQIYEAVYGLILFIVLFRLYRDRLTKLSQFKSGGVFFYYLLFWSLGRLVFEQFRGDSTYLGIFRLGSLIALLVAILSLLGLYYYQFRDFKTDFNVISKNIFGVNQRLKRPFKHK